MVDQLRIRGNRESLQQVSAKEIFNNEQLYDLEAPLQPLIGSNKDTGGYEVYRTATEGRGGVMYFPRGFSRKDSRGGHFHYILYKGIGRPNTKEKYSLDVMENGTYPGFDTVDDVKADHVTTEYLAERGLRTRELMKLWELDEEVAVDLVSGPTSISEVKKVTKIRPSVSAWAMRCRDRVQDVYSEMNEVISPKEVRRIEMGRSAARDLTGAETFTHQPFDLSQEQVDTGVQKIAELAKLILLSGFDDSDQRFRIIYKKYSFFLDTSNEVLMKTLKDEIKSFIEEYLVVFSEILGEQFAVLENNDATIGMFNHQNITLLAELVDHDVTMVGGKKLELEDGQIIKKEVDEETLKLYKLDNSSLEERSVQQLFQAWESIARMICRFSQMQIIDLPLSSEIPLLEKVTQNFLTRFLTKLQPEVREAFKMKLENLLQQNSQNFHPKETTDPLRMAQRNSYFSRKLEELVSV